MALTTIQKVKQALALDSSMWSDDLLSWLITSVSTWFEGKCGRTFSQGVYTETHAVPRDCILPVHTPVTAISSIIVDGIPLAAEDYQLDGDVIRLSTLVAMWQGRKATVTYTAGYAQVPADVEQAVIEMVSLKFQERKRVGTASESASGYSQTFLPTITPRSVQEVIDIYRVFHV